MPYLLARPALRRALGEKEPTAYETGLLNRLRAKAGEKPAGALQGVETIFAALFLARQDPTGAATGRAFDQLATLQNHEGRLAGAWPWYNANLDPWETPPSFFYGASLAALALGSAPDEIHSSAATGRQLHASQEYFDARLPDQPLHSRLALLWASTKVPALLARDARQSLIEEILRKQQPDGAWTIESLGPWSNHPDAPVSNGGNSYATAFTAYVLQQAGAASPRAMQWLASHQDQETGAWPAVSMNKHYPAGSMEEKFLQDAATAFAALALIESAH
jgi:squalene-hopene/tetraprenyl-beta-curcumene cyclase